MMTDFGDALQKAIDDSKENDLTTYVWKLQNGKNVLLMDCESPELNRFYKHCKEMLYNNHLYNPGKFVIRKNIEKIYTNCNTELFVRWLLNECDVELHSLKDILDFINSIRQNNPNFSIENANITDLFTGVPSIYQNIPVSKLMDACFDRLDVINKKMISDKFILSLGIWLTDEEKQDLTEYDSEGKVRSKMEVVKERLMPYINFNVKLKVKPSGLSYAELRSLIMMPNLPKISNLPTATLKTLRDKVLLLLNNDLDYHIAKWENLMHKIEKVAKAKNIVLQE